MQVTPNNATDADVQKRRFALLLSAGYGEREETNNVLNWSMWR
jgi:hypothetical protein